MGAQLSSHFQLDVGALYVLPQKRSTSNQDPYEPPVKGRFGVDAWVFGVTLGIQLDSAGVEPGPYAVGTPAGPCRVRAAAHLPQCR